MKRRIVICLGIILSLYFVGGVIVMLCLHTSLKELSALANLHRIQSMRAELVAGAVRIEADLLAYRMGDQRETSEFLDHVHRFETAAHDCMVCHHETGIRDRLTALNAASHTYRIAFTKLVKQADPTAQLTEIKEAERLVGLLVTQATNMSDQASRHLGLRNTDVVASVRIAWFVLLGTMVAVLVASAIVAYHLKGRLTRPVEEILSGLERVRQGDLNYRFSIDADEEFRTLGAAFNHAYTNLKKIQDGVIQTEKMASVGKLAAGVAHEVGNPLASISSIAQVMRRSSASDTQIERIDLILEQVARIARIVHDLLSFARPKEDTGHERVEIAPLLDQATKLLGYDRRTDRIDIMQQHDVNLRPVRGDGDKLLLVFTNILINAVDAMHSGNDKPRGSINIKAEQEGDRVLVRFQDSGEGMSEEQIANAFEPFFTTKPPGAGTGLGLWICYQTIQRHNGSILIDSREGEGTTVTISLPSESAADPSRPALEPRP